MTTKNFCDQMDKMFELPLTMDDRYMLLQLEQGIMAFNEGLVNLTAVLPYSIYLLYRSSSPDLLKEERRVFNELDQAVQHIIQN